MSEVKVVFKNYKKLRDGEYNLSDNTVFFIQAKNKSGKTTFLNLLQAIMEVKDDTVNPVTFGEKEGYATGTIPGADGNQYQFRYDFNVDGVKKFTFVGPDNKKIKSVGEMRSIFNYTHFTVDEFFNWSHDAKGRAKQKEIIMQLLSESEKNKIIEIDSKINPTSGELFTKRQNINRDVDYYKKIVDAGTGFTEEQKNLINQKDFIEKTLKDLREIKEEADAFINKSSSAATILEMAQKNYDDEISNHDKYVVKYNEDVEDIDKQIKELMEKKDKLKSDYEAHNSEYKENIPILEQKLKEAKEGVDEKKLEEYQLLYKEKELPNGKIQKPIGERIQAGEKLLKDIDALNLKKMNYETSKQTYEDKKKEADNLTEQIETLRKEKSQIIKNSENIPSGIEIGDDYITVDGVPFVETDLCKSDATKTIAQLMMIINKAPLMIMGDAEHLGYEVLDQLSEEAEKHGKIMVFAEQVRDAKEMTLVCYDELRSDDEPRNYSSKSDNTLF